MKKYILILSLVVGSIGWARAQKASDFKATLQRHLDAVSHHNLDDISATVADSVLLIFPDGDTLNGKKKFVSFHRDWFKDPSWAMTTTIVNIRQSGNLGQALVKYHIAKKAADGSALPPTNAYLLLIFEKKQGKWLLVHDQNTKII